MSAIPIGPQVRIRDLRKAMGLSTQALIERIEGAGIPGVGRVHPGTIRNVELGHKRASLPLMTAWARALGVNPVDIWQPSRSDVVIDRDDIKAFGRSQPADGAA